jgi:hypothetical protein
LQINFSATSSNVSKVFQYLLIVYMFTLFSFIRKRCIWTCHLVPFPVIGVFTKADLAVFFQITIDADALVVEVSYSQATVEIRVSFYRNAVGLGSVRYFFKEKYFFRKHRPGLGFL